jgi:hypothetical protein
LQIFKLQKKQTPSCTYSPHIQQHKNKIKKSCSLLLNKIDTNRSNPNEKEINIPVDYEEITSDIAAAFFER